MNIETALKEAMEIQGALGVALVDYGSGMSRIGPGGGGRSISRSRRPGTPRWSGPR